MKPTQLKYSKTYMWGNWKR